MANPYLPKGKGGAKRRSNPWDPTGNGQPQAGLAGLLSRGPKQRPVPKPKTKEDFRHGGLLFHNAKLLGEDIRGYKDGVFRPFGSVDVSNGDMTYTLHNTYGSWMANVGRSHNMMEMAAVSRAMGITMGTVEMYHNLVARFEAELKLLGVPTLAQQRREVERQHEAARKRTRQKEAALHDENPWVKKAKK